MKNCLKTIVVTQWGKSLLYLTDGQTEAQLWQITFSKSDQEERTEGCNYITVNFCDFDAMHQAFPTTPQGQRPRIKAFPYFSKFFGLTYPQPALTNVQKELSKKTRQSGGKSPNNHRWQSRKFNLKSSFIIQNIKIKAIMPKGKHRLKPPMFHSLFLRGSPKH